MWKFVVTPLFTFWMGLAFIVLFTVVGVLGYALFHMLKDRHAEQHQHPRPL
jgi:hypothetical protein